MSFRCVPAWYVTEHRTGRRREGRTEKGMEASQEGV